jgi:selenide,water dikinase
VGLDTPDDAAVYRLSGELALVQTVDFFTPIVDDPYAWGQVAAANALSDIYAMGAAPLTALNLVGWPRSLDFEILGRVLEGGEAVCAEAGVAIVGGHSVDDPEPKYGLSVSGTVHPDRIFRKTGGAPGDQLVLTKAIGTGVISGAIKDGRAPEDVAAAAITSMTQLNRSAAEAMVAVPVNAATDVTGFGLIGHLQQMLGDSLGATVESGSVPLLPGAEELAAGGSLPGGTLRNREAARRYTVIAGDEGPREALLFDAQTSGGLLMAVPSDAVDDLLASLGEDGVPAARIGELVPGEGKIEVRP